MVSLEFLCSEINRSVSSGSSFLFAIDFELQRGLFLDNPDSCDSGVLWRVGVFSNFERACSAKVSDLSFSPISESSYSDMFSTVHGGLMRGDSFLTNLTVRTPLVGELDLEQIARSANSRYLLYCPDSFVCYSPEPFIRVDSSGRISAYPMKGTISAQAPNSMQTLLDDPKELAEHYTIVDLLRSDLSRVASDIRVERFRYVESLRTSCGDILQTSSEIIGNLLPEYREDYGSMLMELLPAGSVSGAPKPTTVELLRTAEGIDRGWYCGVFGYYDGCDLECAVMIRFIERGDDGRFYYRSGGGITINSVMQEEYCEVNSKIYVSR